MKVIALALAVLVGVAIRAADVHAAETVALDPARYVAGLRELRLVDDTLRPQVQQIVDALAAEANEWPRAQVNGRYDARALNVYLLDLGAAGAAAGPKELPGMRGTLRALPEQRIILADARYLAQIKAASEIYLNSVRQQDQSVKTYDALVLAMVEGPDQAVRSRLGERADWRVGTNELFEGAVAFLVAHEMGHVAAGLESTPAGPLRLPRGLKAQDRDRSWACASLVGNEVNDRRAEEAEADAFAADLLGKIPHPASAPRRLRFEHGTLFLQNAELGKVVAALAVLSPRGQNLMRIAGVWLNPEVLDAMRDTLGRDAGMIQTAFPPSHPAQVERLMDVAAQFSTNPMSAYYGETDNAAERGVWSLLIQNVCQAIPAGRREQ